MFDLGFGELLVIGIIALIFIGPKDLPGMFRALGKFTAKIRRMAREFQRAMEDAADETGMKETAKDLKNLTSPSKMGLNKLSEAAEKFDKWDPTKPSERAKNIGDETAKLAEERAETVKKARENAESMAKTWKKPDEADAKPPAGDATEGDAPAEASKSESGS
ncbi:MAG: Sec-independent protein translocase protein TatB [Boseongicola sp.]|nr:Sec-independent protein translocase protein TatB [Boseongicola sp.]MDD9976113.1 Sec-independent protein translocase protein TatB [Boseongicola sp.]